MDTGAKAFRPYGVWEIQCLGVSTGNIDEFAPVRQMAILMYHANGMIRQLNNSMPMDTGAKAFRPYGVWEIQCLGVSTGNFDAFAPV